MNRLQKIAGTAEPETGIQFRRKTYGNSGIRQFLRDVLAMANAAVDGPRYIITGASIDKQGRKEVTGVNKSDFSVNPSYPSLVTDYIEPPIRISYQPVMLKDKQLGVFEISDCQDKPYMMRMDQSERLRRGDAYVRLQDMPLKMGRRQLQVMFEKKFRDSVSADQIEVGFAGEIIHKEIRIPTTDLTKLPSAVAGSKLKEIILIQARAQKSGSTTSVVRLAHARLFGVDRPYDDKSTEELMLEMSQLPQQYRREDENFLFEENVKTLQLVVLNQGEEPIQEASISLVMPKHEAFHVARSLPMTKLNGKYTKRSGPEFDGYPAISLKENLVQASATIGDLPPQVPLQIFEVPIRFCVGSALNGRKIGIRYSLHGRNLRKPAKGKLRLLF